MFLWWWPLLTSTNFLALNMNPPWVAKCNILVNWVFIFSRPWTSRPPKWAKCVHMLTNAKRDADQKAILFPCTTMPKADTESCPKLVQILRLANTNMQAWGKNRQLSWQGPAIVPGDQKCKGCAELQAEESTFFHHTILHPLWCWHKFANWTMTPNRAQQGHRCCCCC